MSKYCNAQPNPEFLIKSIAEQGYTLETALADLIDNSISAGADKIEILTDIDSTCISLYISDNGKGMSELELSENMKFPSRSMESRREQTDLGRFGLGMKTASFSQTRRFTVLSRPKEVKSYASMTWDVDYLRESGEWRIIIDNESTIKNFVEEYERQSQDHLGGFDNYEPNTIIIWQGLYKFEKYISEEHREAALIKQLDEVTSEYLGIVFHRFMENPTKPLRIRINNREIPCFNPFPFQTRSDLRSMGERQVKFGDDVMKMEGCILPAESSRDEGDGVWRTANKGLMDLEGLYVYRGGRIIFFGGWNGLIKKSANLKLARMKIDVGNINDDKLQLNVAKSKIVVPFELTRGVLKYIAELKAEAIKEYFNRGVKKRSSLHSKVNLLNKVPTSKGVKLELNSEYPLLKIFSDSLDRDQNQILRIIMNSINVTINHIRHVHEESYILGVEEKDGISETSIIKAINDLKELGMSRSEIIQIVIEGQGFKSSDLPINIDKALPK